MPQLTMHWNQQSKQQFEALRRRAADTNHQSEFVVTHNEIAMILRDLELAIEKSDPLYNTNKPGGVVRHLLRGFISVTFYLYPDEKVGCITKYLPVPASWPESEE